jgi:hypothetical protein
MAKKSFCGKTSFSFLGKCSTARIAIAQKPGFQPNKIRCLILDIFQKKKKIIISKEIFRF